jgi:hypothetical protein
LLVARDFVPCKQPSCSHRHLRSERLQGEDLEPGGSVASLATWSRLGVTWVGCLVQGTRSCTCIYTTSTGKTGNSPFAVTYQITTILCASIWAFSTYRARRIYHAFLLEDHSTRCEAYRHNNPKGSLGCIDIYEQGGCVLPRARDFF